MTRKLAALFGAIAVALLAGWYVGYWRPSTHSLVAARANLARVQDDEMTSALQAATLQHQRARLGSEERTAAALSAAAPTAPDVPGFIEEVSTLAAQAGVRWTAESQAVAASSASPGAATTSASSASAAGTAGLDPVAVTMAVTGSQQQVLGFIGRLQSADRLYKITTLNLGAPSQAGGASAGAATASSSPSGAANPPGVITYTVSATMYYAPAALPAPPAAR